MCKRLVLVLALAPGCGPAGLPTQPPENDAANPKATVPAYKPSKDPFSGSTFDEENPDEGGGHDHHKRGEAK